MPENNPLYAHIIGKLGDPDQGKSPTEQKIEVFNFEALKGTIAHDERFRGAVQILQNFKTKNPEAFDELQTSMTQARDDKHKRLGISDMSSGEILDSVFDDVNQMTTGERQAALAKIARTKKNVGDGIDELGSTKVREGNS